MAKKELSSEDVRRTSEERCSQSEYGLLARIDVTEVATIILIVDSTTPEGIGVDSHSHHPCVAGDEDLNVREIWICSYPDLHVSPAERLLQIHHASTRLRQIEVELRDRGVERVPTDHDVAMLCLARDFARGELDVADPAVEEIHRIEVRFHNRASQVAHLPAVRSQTHRGVDDVLVSEHHGVLDLTDLGIDDDTVPHLAEARVFVDHVPTFGMEREGIEGRWGQEAADFAAKFFRDANTVIVPLRASQRPAEKGVFDSSNFAVESFNGGSCHLESCCSMYDIPPLV